MQGKKYLLATAAGCLFMTMAGSAFAIMSVPDGWYVEANAGSSKISNSPYGGNTSTSGVAGSAAVGYKFMPYVAGEIGYSQYANTSINAGGTKAATAKNYSYDVAARGILPISSSGFELFAKVGIGRDVTHLTINSSTAAATLGLGGESHSASGIYIGAGAQYYFMPEVAINAQWARQEGNNSTGNADMYSGGVSFMFS